jgi:hypothetical protein
MTAYESAQKFSARVRTYGELAPNSALVNDACGRRYRAFFGASQRER